MDEQLIRAKVFRWKGIVSQRSEASKLLQQPGDGVLVERGRPRLLVMSCPCGCGDELPINLDDRAGPAWRLYRKKKKASLYPSVWRETGCMSHFVVWRNEILLFRADDDYLELDGDEFELLSEAVLSALSKSKLAKYSDIATSLDAIPWDVLQVCRSLVRQGLAIEGKDKLRGQFRRL